MIRNDGQGIRRLKSGERAAFDEVVSRHYQSVYRQLWNLCGDEQISVELTQETFLQARNSLVKLSVPRDGHWKGAGAAVCSLEAEVHSASERAWRPLSTASFTSTR